ncbi:hypothetical protein FMEXI_1649 [Fusarium mexicanum]|uniref:Uncharacterized protein n=1 Tax=Fusarium mexicanum TaxID=751941 RepID=A0A8H5N7U0_9HYPO|nr:hypothetical protein FMEXI_1649 [Fusarium mexicanum]
MSTQAKLVTTPIFVDLPLVTHRTALDSFPTAQCPASTDRSIGQRDSSTDSPSGGQSEEAIEEMQNSRNEQNSDLDFEDHREGLVLYYCDIGGRLVLEVEDLLVDWAGGLVVLRAVPGANDPVEVPSF